MEKNYKKQIDSRRTFAIISHPDAGKTTLTEKFLLFGGAIQLAGAVKAKRAMRHARSDWMEIEKKRGISVTSSVMQFLYKNCNITLLDTPGHEDFCEDTYRVLTAVDSAIMVLDSAKGVESQTRKLFEICRLRDIPIITFVNKLDREGMSPFEIIDKIEEELALECCPITWPIGMGKNFKGVYHLKDNNLHIFSPTSKGKVQEGILINGLKDDLLRKKFGVQADELREDVELIQGASPQFDLDQFRAGVQTPVFFGSAVNNFGIKELLDTFVNFAPPPQKMKTTTRTVDPYEKDFSGFVFKIQANMDPAHRDRIAFLRICSGKYTRGMKLKHLRINKDIQTRNAVTLMAQEKKIADVAYAGDIIGLPNHNTIKIGDTFTEGDNLKFTGIPNFAPEFFRQIILLNPLKSKSLQKGLSQLTEEGVVQLFQMLNSSAYILGVVGVLQFDVVLARLKSEYGVEGEAISTKYSAARWIESDSAIEITQFKKNNVYDLALDSENNLILMAQSQWHIERVEKEWPNIKFLKMMEHS